MVTSSAYSKGILDIAVRLGGDGLQAHLAVLVGLDLVQSEALIVVVVDVGSRNLGKNLGIELLILIADSVAPSGGSIIKGLLDQHTFTCAGASVPSM